MSKMEILLSFLLVTTSLLQNGLKWIYRAESHAVPGLVDAAERSVLIARSIQCARYAAQISLLIRNDIKLNDRKVKLGVCDSKPS